MLDDPCIRYVDQGELPNDKNEAKKISAKAGNYLYEDGVSFKRGKSMPWHMCVRQEEASYIIEEIHQGIYGTHEGATTLGKRFLDKNTTGPL